MSSSPTPSARLDRPLRNLAAWVACFRDAPIPVLDATAEAIRVYSENEDAVDARLLAETVSADPLMTLSLLAHVGSTSRRQTDVETVTAALVLLGIGPFFRRFRDMSTVSSTQEDLPDAARARQGLQAVLERTRRAAQFALGFAAHRMDPDAAVIHEAALLHDLAELLLWCHAPRLATEIAQRQRSTPGLRSVQAQQSVLGIALADLQQALMKAWRLPALLIQLDDERHANSPQVRNVALAVRLARHSAESWDNPAVPDDLVEIGDLLQLGPEPTLKLLRDIDS
ncbi:MAG: HDOD domain-containing protein [Burkholderiaceae bacterium]